MTRIGNSTTHWNFPYFANCLLLKAAWNYGIVDSWNTGFKRMTSFSDTYGKSESKIKIISVFCTQYIHNSLRSAASVSRGQTFHHSGFEGSELIFPPAHGLTRFFTLQEAIEYPGWDILKVA
jgi:hypothetical protein